MPQSPDAAGFAPKRLNGVFYIQDPAVNPPDIHHLRGMQCADCHTGYDTMGDGHIYTRMEDAVEMDCASCHGTPAAVTRGISEKGRPVRGLEIGKGDVRLRSPFGGVQRVVKQARDVVDPRHPDFNRKAALAMTSDHARLACYACHTAWNPNFFGFHFDRNEGFSQLDVLDGDRTEGRVNTQEKVFGTFKQHYLGWNSHGELGVYMVGFSTMATVHAADGSLLVDQEMPVTAAGLSGMTMIHHQPHATTPRARDCVECHRSPSTWGMGSVNFRLTRELLYTAGARGVQVVGFDRKTPANTSIIGQIGLAEVRAFEVRNDDLQGRARTGFAAGIDGILYSIDLRNPLFPRALDRLEKTFTDVRQVLVADDLLYVADAAVGLVVVDASNPARLRVMATFPLVVESGTGTPERAGEARGLFLDGPWLYVAAGSGGLWILDVGDPAAPRVLSRLRLADRELADDANSVSVLFQYSRPNPVAPDAERIPARGLAAVANGSHGLSLVDVTRPEKPRNIITLPSGGPLQAAALATIYEIGSEGGGIRSREKDFVFFVGGGALGYLDVSDTRGPPDAATLKAVNVGGGASDLRMLRVYNPPFLQTYAAVAVQNGVQFVEVTRPDEPAVRGSVAQAGTRILAVEEFPLDRMVDSRGKPLKDISHEGASYLTGEEIRRVLAVPLRDR